MHAHGEAVVRLSGRSAHQRGYTIPSATSCLIHGVETCLERRNGVGHGISSRAAGRGIVRPKRPPSLLFYLQQGSIMTPILLRQPGLCYEVSNTSGEHDGQTCILRMQRSVLR